jgi:hypothetical protein
MNATAVYNEFNRQWEQQLRITKLTDNAGNEFNSCGQWTQQTMKGWMQQLWIMNSTDTMKAIKSICCGQLTQQRMTAMNATAAPREFNRQWRQWMQHLRTMNSKDNEGNESNSCAQRIQQAMKAINATAAHNKLNGQWRQKIQQLGTMNTMNYEGNENNKCG